MEWRMNRDELNLIIVASSQAKYGFETDSKQVPWQKVEKDLKKKVQSARKQDTTKH